MVPWGVHTMPSQASQSSRSKTISVLPVWRGHGELGAERPKLVGAIDVAAGVGRVGLVLDVHVPEVIGAAVELLRNHVLAEAPGQTERVLDDRARLAGGRAPERVERAEVGAGVPVLAVSLLSLGAEGDHREDHRHGKRSYHLEPTFHAR